MEDVKAPSEGDGRQPPFRALPAIRPARPKQVPSGHEGEAGIYRTQARLSRELAENAPDEELRQTLLEVAEQYDRLAEEAEKKG